MCFFQRERKLDIEVEARSNAEMWLKEKEEQLKAEMDRLRQMSSSSHQTSERITQLDKHVADLTEKRKAEQDTTAKYKKSYTDLQQVYHDNNIL